MSARDVTRLEREIARLPRKERRELLKRLVRVSGSHHILRHPSVPAIVNLQEIRGKAKPYQIRQFLKLVERHNLVLEDEG